MNPTPRFPLPLRAGNLFLALLVLVSGVLMLQGDAAVQRFADNTEELARTSAHHLDVTANALEQSRQTADHLRTALQSSRSTMTATSRFLSDLATRQNDYDRLLKDTQDLADALADQSHNTSRTLGSLRQSPGHLKDLAYSVGNALEQSKIFLWDINWILKRFTSDELVPKLDRALMDSANALWSGGNWIARHGPQIIDDSVRTLAASEKALRNVSGHLHAVRTRDLPLLAEQATHARNTIDASAKTALAAEQALDSIQSRHLPVTIQTLRDNAQRLRSIPGTVKTFSDLYRAIGWTCLLCGSMAVLFNLVGLFHRPSPS